MKRHINIPSLLIFVIAVTTSFELPAQKKFRTLAFYSTNVERDHVDFAHDAIAFFTNLSREKKFVFDSTNDWANTNDTVLRKYDLVIWINEFPHNEEQRRAFEKFINNGGAWLGFHVSGYNDKDTHWPWFVDFMGGAVFYNNNWPPLPAKLHVDDPSHPIANKIPASFKAPINEWYQWKPSPRLSKNVKVLLTLDTSNYPIGKKDIIRSGDVPVVWTNTQYKMLYMNMGHGDKIFTDPIQNRLISNAILWIGSRVAH